MRKIANNLALFYILSFTWGILTSLIGFLILIPFIFTKRVYKTHGRLYGVFPKAFKEGWGFEMGCFFFVSYDCAHNGYMHAHEMGHGLQNIVWGPLMLFVISIPSCFRFWYREFKYYRKGKTPNTNYDDIWFEGQATKWGLIYILGNGK